MSIDRLHIWHHPMWDEWNMGGMNQGPRGRISIDLLEGIFDARRIVRHTPQLSAGVNGALSSVHSAAHISRVVDHHECDEWTGSNVKQAMNAQTAFAATQMAAWRTLDNKRQQIHWLPFGGKHHAHRDHSAGFCVFNDMAAAALQVAGRGRTVTYFDTDVHHGDGVEELLFDRPDIVTASIHQGGIYPGTGLQSYSASSAFNYPLDAGAGDEKILAVTDWWAHETIRLKKPDVLLWTLGADAHEDDPLADIELTFNGYQQLGHIVGSACADAGTSLIIGGGGGYNPETSTPMCYAIAVASAARAMGVRCAEVPVGARA